MKQKRLWTIAFSILLALSLTPIVPVIAFGEQDVSITWLTTQGAVYIDPFGFSDAAHKASLSDPALTPDLNDLILIVNRQGKYGFVNQDGLLTVQPEYDFLKELPVSLHDIYSASSEYSIWNYDTLSPYFFYDGMARVSQSRSSGIQQYGFIDTAGVVKIPLEYDGALPFIEDRTVVFKYDPNGEIKMGAIDKTGTVIIPLKYSWMGSFFNGVSPVYESNTEGCRLINKAGETIFTTQYGSLGRFFDGLAAVSKMDINQDWKSGFINKTGTLVIPMEYDKVYNFSEGLARVVNEDGKYGFIDRNGAVVIPFEYDDAQDFTNGVAVVTVKEPSNTNGEVWAADRKCGLVDKRGEIVVPLEHMSLGNANNGFVSVLDLDANKNIKYGIFDTSGNVVIPVEYNYLVGVSNGLFCVFKSDSTGNWKAGVVNEKNETVIPFVYDNVAGFSNGLACVSQKDPEGNDKFGFIDITGEILVPLEYDDAVLLPGGRVGIVRKGASDGLFINPYFTGSKTTNIMAIEGRLPAVAVVVTALVFVAGAILLVQKKRQKAKGVTQLF